MTTRAACGHDRSSDWCEDCTRNKIKEEIAERDALIHRLLEAGLDAAKAGRYSKRCKYHRDPWSLAAHWRVTFPVRDYLSRLAPKLRGIGDDFILELADGTILQGAEAVAYVRRYA